MNKKSHTRKLRARKKSASPRKSESAPVKTPHGKGAENSVSKYKPEFCAMLIEHGRQGMPFMTFGPVVGVSEATLHRWVKSIPEWEEAKASFEAELQAFYVRLGQAAMLGLPVENILPERLAALMAKAKDGHVRLSGNFPWVGYIWLTKNVCKWKGDEQRPVPGDAAMPATTTNNTLILNDNKATERLMDYLRRNNPGAPSPSSVN